MKAHSHHKGNSWPIPAALIEPLHKRKLQLGDVFYDSAEAYEKPWGEALHSISSSIQVVSSIGFELRIAIYKPAPDKKTLVKTGEETMTYEDFYKLIRYEKS